MVKKHIITIAGKIGSGKSSVAKLLATELGYKHYSGGHFMRSIADERGISLMELSKVAEKNESIDREVDNYNLKVGQMNDVVLDSRLGFHFIPESFKVFLEIEPEIAAERILTDYKMNPERHTEATNNFDSKEGVIKNITSRLMSERKRYKEIYGIEDQTDHKNFDLVINTDKKPLNKVVDEIQNKYKEWLKNN